MGIIVFPFLYNLILFILCFYYRQRTLSLVLIYERTFVIERNVQLSVISTTYKYIHTSAVCHSSDNTRIRMLMGCCLTDMNATYLISRLEFLSRRASRQQQESLTNQTGFHSSLNTNSLNTTSISILLHNWILITMKFQSTISIILAMSLIVLDSRNYTALSFKRRRKKQRHLLQFIHEIVLSMIQGLKTNAFIEFYSLKRIKLVIENYDPAVSGQFCFI